MLLSSSMVYGQTNNDPLSTKKSWGSTKIYQNGDKYSHGKILDVMDEKSESYAVLKKASNANFGAGILGGIGGFIIGYQLGASSSGPSGEINTKNILLGAGFIVASIPLSQSYTKNTQKAVTLFNDSLNDIKPTANNYQTSLNLGPGGINFRITF